MHTWAHQHLHSDDEVLPVSFWGRGRAAWLVWWRSCWVIELAFVQAQQTEGLVCTAVSHCSSQWLAGVRPPIHYDYWLQLQIQICVRDIIKAPGFSCPGIRSWCIPILSLSSQERAVSPLISTRLMVVLSFSGEYCLGKWMIQSWAHEANSINNEIYYPMVGSACVLYTVTVSEGHPTPGSQAEPE